MTIASILSYEGKGLLSSKTYKLGAFSKGEVKEFNLSKQEILRGVSDGALYIVNAIVRNNDIISNGVSLHLVSEWIEKSVAEDLNSNRDLDWYIRNLQCGNGGLALGATVEKLREVYILFRTASYIGNRLEGINFLKSEYIKIAPGNYVLAPIYSYNFLIFNKAYYIVLYEKKHEYSDETYSMCVFNSEGKAILKSEKATGKDMLNLILNIISNFS